jgi:carbon monoxide dehydrogenase subunit G
MHYQVSISVDASIERVWAELIDVERWPQYTASIASVERLDDGPFQVGSRARIKQPGLPTLVWTVTRFQAQHEFTWTITSMGVTTTASHQISPGEPGGGAMLTLSIDRTGLLAPLVDRIYDSLTRRYMQMEAEGMKRACEEATAKVAAPA